MAESVTIKGIPDWRTCPRCNGCGTTHRPPWVPGDQQTWPSTNIGFYTCSLCNGLGLVDVSRDHVSRDADPPTKPSVGPSSPITHSPITTSRADVSEQSPSNPSPS